MRPKAMKAAYRGVPLRYLYPGIGAVVAGAGAALISWFHTEPAYIAIATIVLVIAIGWFLGNKEEWLHETAITDPLTDVANRRCFDQRLARDVAESARNGHPLTLLFVDIDQLKSLNDDLGHAAGDAALKLVGESLARTCRSRDLVARWGGDEFAVLASWTTGREGLILAQRIRETLARLGLARGGHAPTVSIGVAELGAGERPEQFLVAADDALYQAKLSGRDRAILAAATRTNRRRRPSMAKLKTRPIRVTHTSTISTIEDEEYTPTPTPTSAIALEWPADGRGERI
jgi:diguanylate cyclase (GGDEF)-like protein